MKIYRRKSTGNYVVVDRDHIGPDHPTISGARAELRRRVRNAARRDLNATLRIVCGQSAAAARRDMGRGG